MLLLLLCVVFVMVVLLVNVGNVVVDALFVVVSAVVLLPFVLCCVGNTCDAVNNVAVYVGYGVDDDGVVIVG